MTWRDRRCPPPVLIADPLEEQAEARRADEPTQTLSAPDGLLTQRIQLVAGNVHEALEKLSALVG
ncbi:hypothetical protein [Micropruina sp.]|uniref:hypothetical protein n=1 Tax=Micropruina sp. TaxID=2737536 RepID=UPI0039E5367D